VRLPLSLPLTAVLLGGLAVGAGCADESPVPSGARVSDGADAGSEVMSDVVLIPARIRRLSNAEYNGSVAALLGTTLRPADSFAPDARQAGFTVNESQRVDSILARQLFSAAEQLAADARGRLGEIAPCPTPQDQETCARWFIAGFGMRAYRRPLSKDESAGLLDVFRVGALYATYEDGIELTIRAMLQSASFLYVTELGDASTARPTGTAVALTQYELATSIAYLMTGAPPDQALLDAAGAGALGSAEARRSHVQRLFRDVPGSRNQLVRTLREWLELDQIEFTAKDVAFYPLYDSLQVAFEIESHEFIGAVLGDSSASNVSSLLGADWTVGGNALAEFYGADVPDSGLLKLTARRGILNQGAFLSVQSHAYESSPVLRGALIARRLACIPIPDPSTLGISVVSPPSDPALTTRQRFDAHVSNPSCAGCHQTIDGFGNAFEQYDGMGGLRQTENGATVDSTTVVKVGADFDGTYPDSNALAMALAASQTVHECFARYLFRAAAARSADSAGGADTTESENAFIAEWRKLPDARRGNVVDTLSAFVSSRLFTHRRVQ
jgi:hypothetical protein